MNSLRITKVDGTVHIVPLSTIQAHHRLNSGLPHSMRARFEEIDADGNVIKVHAEGGKGQIIASENENALLRAEIAKLRALNKDSEKGDVKTAIDKINAATTVEEVQKLSLSDNRAPVMKAAIAKIKTLEKE